MSQTSAIRWLPPMGEKTNRSLTKLSSHLILVVFTVAILYPVVWMIFSSFKTQGELSSNIWGPPQTYAFENYVNAWRSAKLGNALFNSVFVALATVVLVTCLSAVAGFALARFKFRFSTLILLIFVLTMQAPVPVIPLYVLLVRLHLTDSYAGLILPLVAGGLPLSIFILRAFFQAIPRELLEAAIVDGCSQWSAFLRVVVPISRPAIATVAILQFIGAWNEYFLPLILIRSPEMRTLPLAIQVFFYAFGRTEWSQVFAALTVGSLPMIIVYLLLQRQFIQGLTSGAIKG
jgi:raffinose/stachyose/melibiose transport system permease protein